MKVLNFFSVIFCFTLLTGNFYAQDAELKEKFQQMNNEMIEAMMSDNPEAALSIYTDDAISMPSYEPMLKGKSAIMESHKKGMEAGYKMNDMTLTTMDAWSSGNYGYEIGTYTIDMEIPGMGSMKDNGKYLTIWEKQEDDSWKIKVDTWNTDNNPWMNMQMPSDTSDQQ